MTGVAGELDQLRIALGEVEALATVTTATYDSADWVESDPATVDRIALLLGLISKSATAALAAYHRLHGAIADAMPAPAGETWDDSDGTRDEPAGAASAPGNEPAVSARNAEIVRRLRERCVAKLGEAALRSTTQAYLAQGFDRLHE